MARMVRPGVAVESPNRGIGLVTFPGQRASAGLRRAPTEGSTGMTDHEIAASGGLADIVAALTGQPA
jgi:hypothetical protein